MSYWLFLTKIPKTLKKPNKTRVFSNFVWKNPKRTSQKTRVLLAGSFYRANPVRNDNNDCDEDKDERDCKNDAKEEDNHKDDAKEEDNHKHDNGQEDNDKEDKQR